MTAAFIPRRASCNSPTSRSTPHRAVQLRAIFPNHDGLLLPGLYVRATINQGIDPKGILVPQNAVGHNRRATPPHWWLTQEFARLRMLKTGRAIDAIGKCWRIEAG